LEFLNSQPYYASKKIVIQSSDFPVRRTGSYRHKKSTGAIISLSGWVRNLPVIGKNLVGRVLHPSGNESVLFSQNLSNLGFPPINPVAKNCLFSGGCTNI